MSVGNGGIVKSTGSIFHKNYAFQGNTLIFINAIEANILTDSSFTSNTFYGQGRSKFL